MAAQKNSRKESTFIALKVSERQKKINPETMLIYNAALQGMLKNKPSVIRGSLRTGVTREYVCHGYGKNPKDRKIDEYAFKDGVSNLEKQNIKDEINKLVGDIESRAVSAMESANLHICAAYADFSSVKERYGLLSVHDGGIATQVLALTVGYSSRAHTDEGFS